MPNKRRISVTLVPKIDLMLNEVSEKMGVSKSGVVEMALDNFLQEKLKEDAESLAKMKFEDLPSEDEWLLIQSDEY